MNATYFGHLKLYYTSTDRSCVKLSDSLNQLPMSCRLNILWVFNQQLKMDLNNYRNPRYLKKTYISGINHYAEPSEELIQRHIEITERFIECISNQLMQFNAGRSPIEFFRFK